MINQETGLEYANTDPSLHFNRIEPRSKGPMWQSIWIYLLKTGDEDAAQVVYDMNMQSVECEYGDHDYCRSERCSCVHHRATVLSATHTPLLSCREMEIEQREAEWEAAQV